MASPAETYDASPARRRGFRPYFPDIRFLNGHLRPSVESRCRDMADIPFDSQERFALCDLFDQLAPDAPTLIEGWTAGDLAAHLVLRERDPIAGPCLVLTGMFQRVAERRRARLTEQRMFEWLVARIRSGPPPGFFRRGWVRSFPSLNDFFVHHEDVRRANGFGPRGSLPPVLEAALWLNVHRSGRSLSRGCGAVEITGPAAAVETVRGTHFGM